jgi:hypothetical protein
MLSLNRNALQYAKGTKQARYLGPTLFIVMGAMLNVVGVKYDDMDLGTLAGGVVVVIGLALLLIHHKMAKGIKA